MHQERHPAVVLEVDGVDAALGRLHVDVLTHSINVVLGRLGDGVEDRMPRIQRNYSNLNQEPVYLKSKAEITNILCVLKPWLLILLLVLVLVAGDEVDGLFIAVIGLKTHGAH